MCYKIGAEKRAVRNTYSPALHPAPVTKRVSRPARSRQRAHGRLQLRRQSSGRARQRRCVLRAVAARPGAVREEAVAVAAHERRDLAQDVGEPREQRGVVVGRAARELVLRARGGGV